MTRDDRPTLCALGVLAYVAETLLHEALGHGTACLVSGGTITALGPLWMRCSVTSRWILAAGPLANVLGAVLAAVWLRASPPADARWRHALVLFLIFNGLVASGYLAVGGALAFGDWAGVFAQVSPPLAWRIPAIVLGAAGLWLVLRLLATLLRRNEGEGALDPSALTRRVLLPSAAACVAAAAAALAGPWLGVGLFLLPLACTLGVGQLACSIARDGEAAPPPPVTRSASLIAAALLAAAGFVLVIGPAPAIGAAPR